MATGDVSLNPNVRSADTIEFQNALRAKIVGQDDGVQALVELFQVFTAGTSQIESLGLAALPEIRRRSWPLRPVGDQ